MTVLNEDADPAILAGRARQLFPDLRGPRDYPVLAIGANSEQYGDIVEVLGGLDVSQAQAQKWAEGACRGIAAGARGMQATNNAVASGRDALGRAGRALSGAAVEAGEYGKVRVDRSATLKLRHSLRQKKILSRKIGATRRPFPNLTQAIRMVAVWERMAFGLLDPQTLTVGLEIEKMMVRTG